MPSKKRGPNKAVAPPDADDVSAAMETALHIIEAAGQSRAALFTKLGRKGFSVSTSEKVISELEALGAVDDARFAANAAGRRLKKGYGARYIDAELRFKGVETELREETVKALAPEESINAAIKVLQNMAPHREETAQHYHNRLRSALSRRGFSFDEIRAAENMLREEVAQ